MYTIKTPLQFCYITEDQNEWITTGGVPYEGQHFVSKEIAVELLEALRSVKETLIEEHAAKNQSKSNGRLVLAIHKIDKSITNAEQ